jgi:5-hydroxyisourate hydrolase
MITTHVLDLVNGGAARGVPVKLEMHRTGEWIAIGRGVTDENGRLATLAEGSTAASGTYRLIFELSRYHREHGLEQPFFPEATVTFFVGDASEHYHVPLLISRFGYTTYRGT